MKCDFDTTARFMKDCLEQLASRVRKLGKSKSLSFPRLEYRIVSAIKDSGWLFRVTYPHLWILNDSIADIRERKRDFYESEEFPFLVPPDNAALNEPLKLSICIGIRLFHTKILAASTVSASVTGSPTATTRQPLLSLCRETL